MADIDVFNGPITAAALSEWLSGCEMKFELADISNAKKRILMVGDHISKTEAATQPLSHWFTHNWKKLENGTWDDFRDALKENALGTSWRLKVLRDFYACRQGSEKLQDYFERLEESRFTIERTSKVTEIDDYSYKMHMLFGAKPEVVNGFMEDPANEGRFLTFDAEAAKSSIQKYDKGDTTSSKPDPTPSTNPVKPTPSVGIPSSANEMYLTSGLFGMEYSLLNETNEVTFSTLRKLPADPRKTDDITTAWIYWNNTASKPIVQAFYLRFKTSATSWPFPEEPKRLTISGVLNFVPSEYISSVIVTRSRQDGWLTSVTIKTSANKELMQGAKVGEERSFVAPSGWKIVGYQGTQSTNSYPIGNIISYPITKFGVIYAPVRSTYVDSFKPAISIFKSRPEEFWK